MVAGDGIRLNVKQTAEYLGCSEMSVRRYFDSGRLNGSRTRGGFRRIALDEKAAALREELAARVERAERLGDE